MQKHTKPRSIFIIILSSMLGHALESYDFFVYAFLTTIIADQFFPNIDPFISLASSIAVFSIAFISRPLGGLFFGYLGDRYGRKNMFIGTMLLLIVTTVSMGLLPVYSQIGAWASFGMILFRLLQGFAYGGEFTGTTVYLMEFATKSKAGLTGSLFYVALGSGFLLASLTTGVVAYNLSHEEMLQWGWRIPLLLGGLTGVIAVICRLYLRETTDFTEMIMLGEIAENPILHTIKKGKIQVAALMGISVTHALAGIIFFVFIPIFLVNNAGFSLDKASLISIVSICIFIPSALLSGWLSDIIGRRLLLSVSALCLFFFAPFIFYFTSLGYFAVSLAAVIFYAILVAFYASSTVPLVVEIIPRNVRLTSYAIALNLVNIFVSGPSPLIATVLIHYTGSNIAPGYMISLAAAISFITSRLYKEQSG